MRKKCKVDALQFRMQSVEQHVPFTIHHKFIDIHETKLVHNRLYLSNHIYCTSNIRMFCCFMFPSGWLLHWWQIIK